jgi:hypothetical protein
MAPNFKLNYWNYKATMDRIEWIRSQGYTVEIGTPIYYSILKNDKNY